MVLLAAASASAVNIVPVWENVGVFPEEDPDGSAIQVMMGHLETYLEDIFLAPGTLTVYFGYMEGGFGAHNNLSTSGGKPTSCRIRLSADYDWWYDPTPFDDSEFNLVSKRASQYTQSSLNSWYDYAGTTVPDFLEVQYEGYTNSSAPAAARAHFDAWTVLMHEMGHGLGMTGAVAGGEYADDDYDFDPDLVWGNTVAARVADPVENHVHIAAPALMRGGEVRGRRKILSATDIFSIETTCNWGEETIDLRRQDFYSAEATADWNDANWAGNKVPDANDAATIRHGGTAVLGTAAAVESFQLDASSQLAITAGGNLEAGTVTLASGTGLKMELGGTTPGVDLASMHVTGSANVDGTLEITLADGFYPQIGQVFDLFDFDGSRAGWFDNVITPDHYQFDLTNLTVDGSISLTYTGVPYANDDTFNLNEDTRRVWYNTEGVLVNDVDPDTPNIEAIQVTDTQHGMLVLYSTGALEYLPDSDYHGTDSFTYKAFDGVSYSNEALVTFNIASVNDAPVAVDDEYEIDEGEMLTLYLYNGILLNDTDPDNEDGDPDNDDVLSVVEVTDPEHGFLQWYSSGSIVYLPMSGFVGTDSFTYRITDGEATSTEFATVLIHVLATLNIPGDTNGDDIVDATDVSVLADNWGKDVSGGASMGDFNDDGRVNAADASILAANWGDHTEASLNAVPEPSTLVLLLLAMPWILARRRHR